MYRVELKALKNLISPPVGWKFLMYRVELKDGHYQHIALGQLFHRFLMYRVELKEHKQTKNEKHDKVSS